MILNINSNNFKAFNNVAQVKKCHNIGSHANRAKESDLSNGPPKNHGI